MIFTSIYGVVDGLFVSNYVGKTPFAAVNLIMPFLMIMGAVGFMFGTGGSAVVSQSLGEGKPERANQYFSMMVYVVIGSGMAFCRDQKALEHILQHKCGEGRQNNAPVHYAVVKHLARGAKSGRNRAQKYQPGSLLYRKDYHNENTAIRPFHHPAAATVRFPLHKNKLFASFSRLETQKSFFFQLVYGRVMSTIFLSAIKYEIYKIFNKSLDTSMISD